MKVDTIKVGLPNKVAHQCKPGSLIFYVNDFSAVFGS